MGIWDKKNRVRLAFILLLLVCDYCALANVWGEGRDKPQDEFEPGFSGNVRTMVGVRQSESLSQVCDDTKQIHSLDQDASSETGILPVLLWKLGYTFENGKTSIYAGTPEENTLQGRSMIEAGVRQKVLGGTVLTAAWVPNISLLGNEVWSDPFLLGQDRVETDLDAQAFKLEARSVYGSPVTLRYGFGTQDVEDEQSGAYHLSTGDLTADELTTLDRKSDFHLLEAVYTFRFGGGITIRPHFGYMIGDAEGDANSFNLYQGKISVFYPVNRWVVSGNIHAGMYEYDATHPIFDQKREDDEYGCSLGVSYMAPFGWKRMSFDLLTGYKNRNSNINFYDSRSVMAGIGMSWRF